MLIFLLTPIALVMSSSLWITTISFFISYFLIYLIGCNLYHRYWSHKQIQLNKKVEYIITVLGLFSMTGDPLNYARTHRWHHMKTDTDDDPHSPIHGKWHAFVGWMFKPRIDIPLLIIKDLLKTEFKYLQTLGKFQIIIVWSTIVFLGLLSVNIVAGLMLAMCCAFVFEMLVNAISHSETKEIKNIGWLCYITMSSYHGFHHAQPGVINYNDPARRLLSLIRSND